LSVVTARRALGFDLDGLRHRPALSQGGHRVGPGEGVPAPLRLEAQAVKAIDV
jgi:hypothetical protein